GGAGAEADRAAQGQLGAGLLSAGTPRLRAFRLLVRPVPAHPQAVRAHPAPARAGALGALTGALGQVRVTAGPQPAVRGVPAYDGPSLRDISSSSAASTLPRANSGGTARANSARRPAPSPASTISRPRSASIRCSQPGRESPAVSSSGSRPSINSRACAKSPF